MGKARLMGTARVGRSQHWLLAGITALVGVVPQARAEPLSDIVRYALQEHPRTRAARAGAEASGFIVEQARSARQPQLAMVANPGRQYDSSGASGQEVGEVGLRGSVLLYDGGRTREAIGREEDRVDVADAGVRQANDDLAARLVEVYLEWYRQDRLAALAADNLGAHQALHDRVREIASFDRGRASDLLQVGARLEQSRVVLAAREGAAEEAHNVLRDMAGRDIANVEPPRDPAAFLPASLADARGLLEQHPLVVMADTEARIALRSSQLALAWNRPRLDLVATVGSAGDAVGERHYFDDYSVRLAAIWAPVDGGAGRAGARAAERQALQSREGAQAVRRELSARVTALWTQMGARRERIRVYRGLVEQTTQVREAYWQQFTIGRRSIIDLLNAESESFQARLAAEDERIELLQVQHRLLAAAAMLTSWLGLEPDLPARR
jgi:outer membrane protein TolC